MLVGPPGSGKSKAITTLPGKKFVFAFDPAAGSAYAGDKDIDLIQYRVDSMNLAVTIKRERPGTPIPVGQKAPETYAKFGADLTEFVNSGLYKNYDFVIVDSATTFEAAERDHVMFENNTYGHVPKMDDHNLVANQTIKVFRMLTNLPCSIVFIVHDTPEQDEITKRIFNRTMLTGKVNRRQLPVLFNHVLRTEADQVTKNGKLETRYFLITTSDRVNPYVRTSWKNLDAKVDVTIDNFSNPQQYGLGKILKEQK